MPTLCTSTQHNFEVLEKALGKRKKGKASKSEKGKVSLVVQNMMLILHMENSKIATRKFKLINSVCKIQKQKWSNICICCQQIIWKNKITTWTIATRTVQYLGIY